MPTNIMQAQINLRNMNRWMSERRHSDPDRALHCLVAETFGVENPLRPFALKAEGKPLESSLFLAYTPLNADQLREHADEKQPLALQTVLNPETIRTAPLPESWPAGTIIAFEARIKPVRRWNVSELHPKGPGSGERDAHNSQSPGSREESYIAWFQDLINRRGGMAINSRDCQITHFCYRTVRRNKNGRQTHEPDATIKGRGIVTDSDAFNNLLTNGVSRLKSYGYGMLLVKPVTDC